MEEVNGFGDVTARYVYGQYIDEILQRDFDTNGDGAADELYYYLHDDLYNVVGVTDDTGTLVERYEYGDYGQPSIFQVPPSGPEIALGDVSAIGNRYLFNGREYDSGTGHYWYRTRYMDPEQGRFIARDTIGPWGDPNNLGNPFAYVGNNPWSRLDPYGETGGLYNMVAAANEFHNNEAMRAEVGAFFSAGVSGMPRDAALGVKGLVWTGPKNFAESAVTMVAHPVQAIQGMRAFVDSLNYSDNRAALKEQFYAGLQDPEAIGSFTFSIMADVASAGAAKAAYARYGTALGEMGASGATRAGRAFSKVLEDTGGASLNLPGEALDWMANVVRGRRFDKLRSGVYEFDEVYLEKTGGFLSRYTRVDSYSPSTGEIISRKHTQLSEVTNSSAMRYLSELASKYKPGTRIADVPSNRRRGLAGQLEGQMILEVPVQTRPVPASILEKARTSKIRIRDIEGHVYR